MENKNEIKNEELEKVSGGNTANDSVTIIQNAIYKSSSILAYVNGVYDNRAVSYYKATYSNGIYKYGGFLQKTTVASFKNNFDVNNPITNVTVIKA